MEQHSAGGIIIKKLHNTFHVLLIKDMNDLWTFPKGIIESGESTEIAAIREIKEEVGLSHLKLLQHLDTITYWFVRDQIKIHKTVDYFLFESTKEELLQPQTEEGISEVKWVDLEEATKIVGYPKTSLPLLEQVKTIILSS